jgi:hypothetical protein
MPAFLARLWASLRETECDCFTCNYRAGRALVFVFHARLFHVKQWRACGAFVGSLSQPVEKLLTNWRGLQGRLFRHLSARMTHLRSHDALSPANATDADSDGLRWTRCRSL